ncbi:MAG: GAF domain-containing protein, partial [Treponema sp.]|nr:GAF domain-containing protein [Treponema sp.]
MKQKKSVPKQKGQSLKDLFVIERKFDSIQDIDVLLERILSEVRKIVNADAGSIYEVNNGMLRVLHAQNDTREKTLSPGEKLPYVSLSIPINEKSIAGYVAYKGEPLNIPDVYDISPSESYSYNKQMDEYSGYRTKSMYTIPLRLQDGKMI